VIGISFNDVVGWSNIVGASVALLVVVVGALASSSRYQARALFARRRRYLLRALRQAGWRVSRRRFGPATRALVGRRVARGHPVVQEEVAWLSALVAATAAPDAARVSEQPRRAQSPVPVPLTFSVFADDIDYEQRLALLARAYDNYAVAVRRRWLLRSTAGPLVAEEYACARETASQLRRWASFRPIPPTADPTGLRGYTVTLPPTLKGPGGSVRRSVRLVTWPQMDSARSSITFPLVGASFHPYRVTVDGRPVAEGNDGLPRQLARVTDPIGEAARDPLTFDGVLTRWHGDGFRLEIDGVTGRQKLHLCLSETSYFAFRATQVPEAAAKSSTPGLSRLLSLNLVAMDSDEKVLLVRRSDYVVHAGGYAGTVSGNCELVSREGVHADVDAHGFPDVMTAIAREAREELGLDLSRPESQLGALGVVEIDTDRELGTHILVATALLPESADQFEPNRSAIDPVEGAWEIGDRAMLIDIREATRSASHAKAFIAWLRSASELTPHAVGALLLLVIARQQLRERQSLRARASGRPHNRLTWTSRDLAEWLREPPPPRPPDVTPFVRERPLFNSTPKR
jgi:8-oxo-dGTP pyrophosphatase MutT (NUDIX family)